MLSNTLATHLSTVLLSSVIVSKSLIQLVFENYLFVKNKTLVLTWLGLWFHAAKHISHSSLNLLLSSVIISK
jgi:hypothetical protein